MKAGRIIGILLFVLLILYLLLFHAANPVLVTLPWLSALLPPLPVSYIVILALVVGLLIGWLPARALAWRRGREVKRLQKRVAELEPASVPLATTDPYYKDEYPVIPDRTAQYRADPLDDTEAG